MLAAAEELAATVGVWRACAVLGVPRSTLYRRRRPRPPGESRSRPPSPRALNPAERRQVLDVLHSERFCDVAPAEVMATLLDEGIYLCSERTMYRLLAKRGASRERHNQLRHPHYRRPELLATGPNQLWSWDITKLLGPAKWTYYYLYVILDVFSRYVTGWMVAHRETAALARRLIADTIASEQVPAGTLTVHADRGSSMTSPICTHRTEIGADTTNSPPRTRASHQPRRRSALRGWYTGRLESDHRPHSLITVGPRQQPSA